MSAITSSPCSVLYFDNAVPEPWELRQRALASSYDDVDVPNDATYKRVSVQPIPELSVAVEHALGRPLQTVGTAFRLNYGGELANNYVHADVGYGSIAAVLYLSRPQACAGGTAFWRHTPTGASFHGPEVPVSDWDREEPQHRPGVRLWQQEALVPMQFNRLVVYSTQRFHSRWPHAAFGTCPEDGRLIAIGFFNSAARRDYSVA